MMVFFHHSSSEGAFSQSNKFLVNTLRLATPTPDRFYPTCCAMVDWNSPSQMANDAGMFGTPNVLDTLSKPHRSVEYRNFIHVLAGIYMYVNRLFNHSQIIIVNPRCYASWEFLVSFDFDWKFLTRELQFKWPMVRGYYFECFRSIADQHMCRSLIFLVDTLRHSSSVCCTSGPMHRPRHLLTSLIQTHLH